MINDFQMTTGISYTVIAPENRHPYACVWHRNEVDTHRNFMLTKMKEGVKKSEFSSCGILLYDGEKDKWFPIFTSSYKKNMTVQERSRDLLLACREATKVYADEIELKHYLFELAVRMIAEQEQSLRKIGLPEEYIKKVILRTQLEREECFANQKVLQRG
ncbi:MAG: hypothetical protein IKL32_04500 [Alphaproteobacteria bacterium]|nr:hypothetical protein [Alphaproteobacteria bacterium]